MANNLYMASVTAASSQRTVSLLFHAYDCPHPDVSFLTPVIGQFPDMFTAAGIRNPVISCGEFSITDIPDWYFFEFGLPYNSGTIMTPKTYATLRCIPYCPC